MEIEKKRILYNLVTVLDTYLFLFYYLKVGNDSWESWTIFLLPLFLCDINNHNTSIYA